MGLSVEDSNYSTGRSAARPWQPEIVARILAGIRSGQKTRWIIDAPAGSGKTLMAMSLSKELSSALPDLKTYVAVRTKNEMSPYDETNRKFGLGMEIKYLIGKSKLCDVYAPGDETNTARCEVDLSEFALELDGRRETMPPRKRVDTSGLAGQYSQGLQSIYALVGTEVCPYVSNKYRRAPFTVMTYNHLLNDAIRSRSRIRLSESLLVVDEAHNLETAATGSSFDLTVVGLARAAEYYARIFDSVQHIVELHGPRWGGGPVPRAEEVADSVTAFKGLVEGVSPTTTKTTVRRVRRAPYRTDTDGEDVAAPRSGARLVDKARFTAAARELLDGEFGVILAASDAIEFGRNLLMVTRPGETLRNPFHSVVRFISELVEDEGQDVFGLFSEGDGSVSLKAIDPAVTLSALNEARFLVMMSGTMPKRSYVEKVWGIEDVAEASVLRDFAPEYRRVFPRENLAIDLKKTRLTTWSRYREWRGEALWRSYARLIERTHLKHSRRSSLVCVPSYPVAKSIFDSLSVEPRFLESGETSVDELKAFLLRAGRPAVVVAVSRGKLLEGVELVEHGRSLIDVVIVAGIPYPAPDDVYQVRRNRILRRLGIPQGSREAEEFADEYMKRQPAVTAVNQAIGRAIRNPEDRAKVFLLDRRFKSARWRRELGLEAPPPPL